MDILKIAGVCILCTIMCKLTEKENKEIKILLLLGCISVIFVKISEYISGISDEVKSLIDIAGVDSNLLKILLKGLGICCITQLAVDYCKDCGENALASQACLGGKIALLITAFPLFESLINIVRNLLA